MNFSSLLLASEKKGPFDDLIGRGEELNTLAATALPQGTVRKHYKGYEEVTIPPTPTAAMKPGEKLVCFVSLNCIECLIDSVGHLIFFSLCSFLSEDLFFYVIVFSTKSPSFSQETRKKMKL